VVLIAPPTRRIHVEHLLGGCHAAAVLRFGRCRVPTPGLVRGQRAVDDADHCGHRHSQRQRVDAEVKRIVGEAHDEAIRLPTEHRERLDSLAEALLRAETLDQPEAYAAAGLAAPEAETPTTEPALTGAA
jgi:hypothetical protein